MKQVKAKRNKDYLPPSIYSEIIYLEEGIAALSEVKTTNSEGKIFEQTVEESIGESFDW